VHETKLLQVMAASKEIAQKNKCNQDIAQFKYECTPRAEQHHRSMNQSSKQYIGLHRTTLYRDDSLALSTLASTYDGEFISESSHACIALEEEGEE
jgi:hypothetical protein